jgi:uncharacterized membrane protein
MKIFIIAYLSSIVPMLAIDGVWLATMSKRFYAVRLGSIMATSPKLIPAAVFYLIYNLGVALLVVVPAVDHHTTMLKVLLYGGLLGLVAYGTYDLTNQATLREWSPVVTIVDLVWGALLTSAVSVIAVSFTRYVK